MKNCFLKKDKIVSDYISELSQNFNVSNTDCIKAVFNFDSVRVSVNKKQIVIVSITKNLCLSDSKNNFSFINITACITPQLGNCQAEDLIKKNLIQYVLDQSEYFIQMTEKFYQLYTSTFKYE